MYSSLPNSIHLLVYNQLRTRVETRYSEVGATVFIAPPTFEQKGHLIVYVGDFQTQSSPIRLHTGRLHIRSANRCK